MVKEIEISNNIKLLEAGQELDFERYPELITASLSNDGQTMTVVVNRNLKARCARSISLSYMLPVYDLQVVNEYEIGVQGPSLDVTAETKFVFDLSMVLRQIAHPSVEQVADETVSIRQYTYESNMPFSYGSTYPQYSETAEYSVGNYVQYGGRLWECRKTTVGHIPTDSTYWVPRGITSSGTVQINVPFTVSYPGNTIIPKSTDGWYVVRVSDVAVWQDNVQYLANDIVYDVNGYYKCVSDSLNDLTVDIEHWLAFSADGIRDLYEFGHVTTTTVPTLVNSDLLVTRYIKQKHIYELFMKTSYKHHDNIVAVTQLEKIYAMRETAVVHLRSGNPIAAREILDLITIEINGFAVNHTKPIGTITNLFTI